MTTKSFRPHFTSTSDPRVLRTRDALRAALLALLENRSLDEITIPEITATAGIGRTSFFRHYPSKDALLDDVAMGEVRQLLGLALEAFEASDIKQASRAIFTHVGKHRKLWTTLLTGGAAPVIKQEFFEISRQVTASTNAKSSWLPPDAGMILVVGSMVDLLTWWLQQKTPIPVDNAALILERAVLAPIYEA